MMHSHWMDGPELLQLLLDSKQLTPNALADRLRNRSLQSQMQRYLARETKSPRPSTLEPLAKFFGIGVEAFYQPAIAKAIADERGLGIRQGDHIEERVPTYTLPANAPTPLRPRPAVDVADLVAQLGRLLEPYDAPARSAVGALLHDVAINPSNAGLTGKRIAALLDVPGNAPQEKSTSSL